VCHKADDDGAPSDDEIIESDEDSVETSLPETEERQCVVKESSSELD